MSEMRIAIPRYKGTVSGAYELSDKVSLHLLDFATMEAKDEGEHAFPAVAESFQWFEAHEVQAVVMGTIDPDNAEKLSEKGIHVFTGAGDLTPAQTVEQFQLAMATALRRRPRGGADSGEGHECCGGKGHDDGSECCGGKGHGDSDEGCCGKHSH
jgi:predicted Fe-Mo cluster-binding NifX family protein